MLYDAHRGASGANDSADSQVLRGGRAVRAAAEHVPVSPRGTSRVVPGVMRVCSFLRARSRLAGPL